MKVFIVSLIVLLCCGCGAKDNEKTAFELSEEARNDWLAKFATNSKWSCYKWKSRILLDCTVLDAKWEKPIRLQCHKRGCDIINNSED